MDLVDDPPRDFCACSDVDERFCIFMASVSLHNVVGHPRQPRWPGRLRRYSPSMLKLKKLNELVLWGLFQRNSSKVQGDLGTSGAENHLTSHVGLGHGELVKGMRQRHPYGQIPCPLCCRGLLRRHWISRRSQGSKIQIVRARETLHGGGRCNSVRVPTDEAVSKEKDQRCNPYLPDDYIRGQHRQRVEGFVEPLVSVDWFHISRDINSEVDAMPACGRSSRELEPYGEAYRGDTVRGICA